MRSKQKVGFDKKDGGLRPFTCFRNRLSFTNLVGCCMGSLLYGY